MNVVNCTRTMSMKSVYHVHYQNTNDLQMMADKGIEDVPADTSYLGGQMAYVPTSEVSRSNLLLEEVE